jgi:cell wall-associated NlpC family hydrolase
MPFPLSRRHLLIAGCALALTTRVGAQGISLQGTTGLGNLAPDNPGRDAVAEAEPTLNLGVARAIDAMLDRAMRLQGTRYRAGGNSPETGFDCSGFVGYLYRDILGFQLPRSAHQIWQFGRTVERPMLRPGDLVFYNTMRRPYSHVGLFLGDDTFVHAPASGGRVRTENMGDRYWAARWNGAKRVTP